MKSTWSRLIPGMTRQGVLSKLQTFLSVFSTPISGMWQNVRRLKSSDNSNSFYLWYRLFIILYSVNPGSANLFTTNPSNVTACLGSSATFTCSISQPLGLGWLVNGMDYSSVNGAQAVGTSTESILKLPAISILQSAAVECYYIQSSSRIKSSTVTLFVQAPPSAPINVTTTAINGTSVLLAWGKVYNTQSISLSYVVLVTNSSGASVFSRTVMEPPVIITTPDPCDHYEATVTYTSVVNCSGNGTTVTLVGGTCTPAATSSTSSQQHSSITPTATSTTSFQPNTSVVIGAGVGGSLAAITFIIVLIVVIGLIYWRIYLYRTKLSNENFELKNGDAETDGGASGLVKDSILVILDNSNLWTQSKKFRATNDIKEDHRVRISFPSIKKYIQTERNLQMKKNVVYYIYDQKQSQVPQNAFPDWELITEIDLKITKNIGTIIIITGSYDVAQFECIIRANMKVQVYYLQRGAENIPLMGVEFYDLKGDFDQITFIEYDYNGPPGKEGRKEFFIQKIFQDDSSKDTFFFSMEKLIMIPLQYKKLANYWQVVLSDYCTDNKFNEAKSAIQSKMMEKCYTFKEYQESIVQPGW